MTFKVISDTLRKLTKLYSHLRLGSFIAFIYKDKMNSYTIYLVKIHTKAKANLGEVRMQVVSIKANEKLKYHEAKQTTNTE